MFLPLLHRQFWRVTLTTMALCFWNNGVADEVFEQKMQITSGYLYHFTQFTEWATPPPVLHYCVYDNTDVTASLRESYRHKRAIEVRDITQKSTIDDCQLIYFSQTAPADFFKKISKLAILSIGTQQDLVVG
ncbi:MAG: YfiR family protein [Methylococcales bacterium]|nr:YfiR family protein [Methylococcales bacterium]